MERYGRRWDGEEEERGERRYERERYERDRAGRGAGRFDERYPEREVYGRGQELERTGDWRDVEPYQSRREDPDDRRYRGGRPSRWESEGGYPLGGYPHMRHWHAYGERAESVEPRRWPEGVHAPWEDREYWERGGREREGRGREEGHLEHRIAEGIRRFFRGGQERGPHAGKGPKGYRRSDERIREDVCDRIASRGWIDASDVDVRVSEGEVTLLGTVESRRDKRLLEDMIDDVSGVRDVHNQVRVRRESGARDATETRSRTS